MQRHLRIIFAIFLELNSTLEVSSHVTCRFIDFSIKYVSWSKSKNCIIFYWPWENWQACRNFGLKFIFWNFIDLFLAYYYPRKVGNNTQKHWYGKTNRFVKFKRCVCLYLQRVKSFLYLLKCTLKCKPFGCPWEILYTVFQLSSKIGTRFWNGFLSWNH